MKIHFLLILVVIISLTICPVRESFASNNADLIKSGLLGAGAGAVGGAVSGAKGGDLWKGALAGAGVNIIGGMLMDSMSGEKVKDVKEVDSSPPKEAFSNGYQDGFGNGYKKGYTDGYKTGLRESYSEVESNNKKGPPDWAPAHGYRRKQGN